MVVAFLFCGAVFGIAGIYATNGYADLLWSAGALAATVYGLVLPREWRNLAVAWLALLVASLTKDEGFLVGIAISLLIAARYAWPVAAPRVRWLLQFGAMAVGPLIPAAVWFALIHEKGISSSFPISPTTSPSGCADNSRRMIRSRGSVPMAASMSA
jgi:hypothetical protein